MKYEHILWCKEDNHDKVWGIIELGIVETEPKTQYHWRPQEKFKYVTFWGRRGKSLQTKVWEGDPWKAREERDKKCKKGYKVVQPIEMNDLYPEFEEDLQKTAVWAMLGG
jgi:hypothetical protein